MSATPPTKKNGGQSKEIEIQVDNEFRDFPVSVCFNIFDLERLKDGSVLLRVAYRHSGVGYQILPIIISIPGLVNFKKSIGDYLNGFKEVQTKAETIAFGDALPPLFSNNILVSKSGGMAEIALFTVPLHLLANVIMKRTTDKLLKGIPVALLYSDVVTHEQVTMQLLSMSPSE